MNPEKYTKKSLEAVQEAQNSAIRHQHSQIEPIHLLEALLTQENGLIPQILSKMTVNNSDLKQRVEKNLSTLPRLSGNPSLIASPSLHQVLVNAEDQAKHMQDEYVSVEHHMMALLE